MSNAPYAVDVEEGKLYSWCTCGFSQKKHFCDGSNRYKTEKRSLKWTAPKTCLLYTSR
ncbi:MAG: CDGSH iron-sulfur domain-containing protein, partial [Alphaproteobacteria bacterium]|nr:CDGSH iron-sulfur domain-containing protein [Alphaproteobacteria bacterium]